MPINYICGCIAKFMCYIFVERMHSVIHDILIHLRNIYSHIETQTLMCRDIASIYVLGLYTILEQIHPVYTLGWV